jgi:hydrogenase maturation protease
MISPSDISGLTGASPTSSSSAPDPTPRVLLLGVGNWLMGDEGVGIHVVNALEAQPPLFGVRVLDGGTGGINLLIEFDGVSDIVMVDATIDGKPEGTITLLQPKRVADLPRGLGAHDFGVKDLFAASALLGKMPNIYLYTISVETLVPMCTELSPAVAAAVPEVVQAMHAHAARLASETQHHDH